MEKENKVDAIVRVLKNSELIEDEFGYNNFESIEKVLKSIAVSIIAELAKNDLEEGHRFPYIVITGRTNKRGKTVKFGFKTVGIRFINLTDRKNSKGKKIHLVVSTEVSEDDFYIEFNESVEFMLAAETIMVKSSGGYVDYRIAAFG